MPTRTDWPAAIRPLLEKYKGTPHPLEHRNTYQLIVMVVLSAQSTDDIVNKIAPAFFAVYPNLARLATAQPEDLYPLISKVRNFGHKAAWLVGIAKQLGTDARIPETMEELTALPGIGRKSASVILRESGRPPEGIIVDIHVVRVAPRLGIAKEGDPKQIEEQMMKVLPRDEWDAGMAMSFLGREICRPTPECERCLMNPVCDYYARNKGRVAAPKTRARAAKKAAKKKAGPAAPKKARSAAPKEAAAKSPKKPAAKRVKKRAGRGGK
jgi:endonuclease-3